MKIWVIDNATIKITNAIGGKKKDNDAEIVNKKNATRFMWIPGKRPVKSPNPIPKSNAIASSRNILLF